MDIRPGNAWWQGRREEQQDAFGFVGFNDAELRAHGGVLVVLADGMGGMHNGRAASRAAVDAMMAAYATKTPEESIPAALERALAEANQAVYSLALSSDGEGEVGTTLVAAVVHEQSAYWISAGDSRLYLYQASDASMTQCTLDHTYANALWAKVARGEMSRAEVDADPDRHALVSFLGLQELPDVDLSGRPRPLAAGDRLLLCSDGVYGTLPEPDMALLLRQDAQAAADALIRAVKDRAGADQDNATAAVLAIGPPPTGIATEPDSATETPPPRRISKLLGISGAALLVLLIGIGIGFYLIGDGVQPGVDDVQPQAEPEPNIDAPATPDDAGTPSPLTAAPGTGDPASSTETEPKSEPASALEPALVPEPDAEPNSEESSQEAPGVDDSAEQPDATDDAESPPMSGTEEAKPQAEIPR